MDWLVECIKALGGLGPLALMAVISALDFTLVGFIFFKYIPGRDRAAATEREKRDHAMLEAVADGRRECHEAQKEAYQNFLDTLQRDRHAHTQALTLTSASFDSIEDAVKDLSLSNRELSNSILRIESRRTS